MRRKQQKMSSSSFSLLFLLRSLQFSPIPLATNNFPFIKCQAFDRLVGSGEKGREVKRLGDSGDGARERGGAPPHQHFFHSLFFTALPK